MWAGRPSQPTSLPCGTKRSIRDSSDPERGVVIKPSLVCALAHAVQARPIGLWRARPTASAGRLAQVSLGAPGGKGDKTRSLHRPCRKARGCRPRTLRAEQPLPPLTAAPILPCTWRLALGTWHVALGAAPSPPIEGPIPMTRSPHGPLRVGIGGPVGSGKTALMEALCKLFRNRYDICAITNDIYTKEDALILTRAGALPEERIMGVETGGCPHTAIREDASINLAAIIEMRA